MRREFRSSNLALVKATCAALAFWMVATLTGTIAYAQRDPERYAADRCQNAIRQRMVRDLGGSDPQIDFDQPQVNQTFLGTQCEGSGVYTRDDRDRGRQFTYSVNLRFGNVERVNYRLGGYNTGGNYYRPDDG